jgi:hypothetical protein
MARPAIVLTQQLRHPVFSYVPMEATAAVDLALSTVESRTDTALVGHC